MMSAWKYASSGPSTRSPANMAASSATVMFSATSWDRTMTQVVAPATIRTRPAMMASKPASRADAVREVVRHFVAARCGERADIEQQIEWLLRAQRVLMGQRVALAPGPLAAVRPEALAQVGEARLPGSLHRVGAAFRIRVCNVVQ